MLVTSEVRRQFELLFCNFDSVGEPYPENDLWQLVLSIEATPMFLGDLSKLEDHGESGLVRQAPLRAYRPVAHDRERTFDGIRGIRQAAIAAFGASKFSGLRRSSADRGELRGILDQVREPRPAGEQPTAPEAA